MASIKNKEKTLLHMVDWRGASVTPRGISGSSDAPGKDGGGMEINLSPCYKVFSDSDIIFQQPKNSMPAMFGILFLFVVTQPLLECNGSLRKYGLDIFSQIVEDIV